MSRKQKKVLIRIIITTGLLAVLIPLTYYREFNRWVELAMFLVPYAVIGYDILRKAFKGIIRGQVLDENFLMVIATIGALALGEHSEGVAVMLFYQVGELFQSYAVGKSRRSISELMDIRPDVATVENEEGTEQVDPNDVPIGSIIQIRPGEKIPIDGIVIEGKTSVNTCALTGESVPRDVVEGGEVISGCINISGLIRVKTTKEFGESTVSKILEMVENAGLRKSRSENFISKFAKYYTPAVCIGALALALLPPLVSMMVGSEANWLNWVYRGLTFLVISCPCALVISIPLSFFAGIGGAGREGILIKGSNFLEALSKTECVVFDKTGTVTQGVFEVTGIHHNELEDEKILELAALVEGRSTHPIAKSLVAALPEDFEVDFGKVSDLEEISGQGITAVVDGRKIAVGNSVLMNNLSVKYIDCHHVGTIVHIAIDDEYAGHIIISDIVKPSATEAMTSLKKAGIKRTVMLTGDVEKVAADVAKKLGIDEYHSELLPQDKVSWMEKLLSEKDPKKNLAFVGDGINDAPVLTRADIGIAMGAIGSDAAIEAADVVLMDDDPRKIAKAVRISKKCMRIVYENIWFALGVKALCLMLGAVGIANMWIAIFADVGVMIIAVLNAIRALNVRKM